MSIRPTEYWDCCFPDFLRYVQSSKRKRSFSPTVHPKNNDITKSNEEANAENCEHCGRTSEVSLSTAMKAPNKFWLH